MRQADSPGVRLRSLMDAGCVAMPGAFNALAGIAIRDAGFDACYVSGAATTAGAGVPDVGVLTLGEFVKVIGEVARASGLPVLADADTGFGEAEMVRRTVIEYARAGAAGLHIEDQQFPKRCGHLDGKALIPTDHMLEKVAWARKASDDATGGSFVVCARTDAAGVEGVEAAIARARAFVEAGADMIFPEGLRTREEFAEVARSLKGGALKAGARGGKRSPYLLANMTEFGKTPMIPLHEFAAMGYDCVIYPVTLLRVAMGAVTRALATLKEQGTAEPLLGEMLTRQELYRLLGYTPGTAWEWRE